MFLSGALAGRELPLSVLISQVISNVPAAILLSNYTENIPALLIGTNLGGLGTLIASMASLISYKYIARVFPEKKGIVSEKVSETMRSLLESVVSEGSGSNAGLEGYSIGGKTATSQTLPRSANKYIASFVGFAPAEDPQVLGMVIIHDPRGVYYGGTIAAPVLREIFDNVLPYLGIEKK